MNYAPQYGDDIEDTMPLKARPRSRTFELSSPPSTAPSTPPPERQTLASPRQTTDMGADGTSTPMRTRSILNLTSSTLFGIYQTSGYTTEREEPGTPWGSGAETPVRSKDFSLEISKHSSPNGHVQRRRSTLTPTHHRPRRGLRGWLLPVAGRQLVMASVGVMYGLLISHLHDREELAPVKVEGIHRESWTYLSLWGALGVALGEALPWLDRQRAAREEEFEEQQQLRKNGHGTGDWFDVVRAIGIFVGIAFAIRKLPWQSTMQLSLTLAIANPALWYLIDRTAAGFLLSTGVAFSGTVILLGISPALVPSPSAAQITPSRMVKQSHAGHLDLAGLQNERYVLGYFSLESVGVATWVASVLFVSAVCFGNIGRRLVPQST